MKRFLTNIKRIFSFPVIAAVVLGSVIIWLLPPMFKKYEIKVVDHQNIYYNNHIHFEDLNNDGSSEKISLSSVNSRYSYANFYDEKESLSNVWNLKGEINNKSLTVGDYNNDGIKDVYLLTMYKDSLFINSYRYTPETGNETACHFITTISKHYEKPDYGISQPIMKDIDNDDYQELIFSLYGKYSLQPRQIIIYDIPQEHIRRSVSTGTIMKDIKVMKSPNDNNFYITGNTSITNYIGDSLHVPYKDDKAWLLVYNRHLRPQFEPHAFEKQGTITQTYPITYKSKVYFVTLITNHFSYEDSRIIVCDIEGDVVAEKTAEANKFVNIFKNENLRSGHFYVMTRDGNALLMNRQLKTLKSFHLPNIEESTFQALNAGGGDKHVKEIIQWIPSVKKAIIYKKHFTDNIEIKLSELESRDLSLSVKKIRGKNQICFKDYNHYYLVSYNKSKLFILKYFIYVGIYVMLFLVGYAIKKTVALRQLERERTISQIKLASIKNQIDPHFTLNALNAIGSSILNDYKKESYEYLQRFSRLIRHTLTEADNISRSLNEEINFIKDYLDVMQIRYVDKFDYQLEVENNVDLSIHVPKMIIQSFVENAIKHGIKHKEGKGNITISIANYYEGVRVVVQDDGIGRSRAESRHDEGNTGKGIQNLNEYINIFNKYNRNKISYRIIDLFDNRKAVGTKVIIYIPYDYEYKIH